MKPYYKLFIFPVAQFISDFALDIVLLVSLIEGYPRVFNLFFTTRASYEFCATKDTVDVSILTVISDTLTILASLLFMLVAQPPHFKFCTIIEVLIGMYDFKSKVISITVLHSNLGYIHTFNHEKK